MVQEALHLLQHSSSMMSQSQDQSTALHLKKLSSYTALQLYTGLQLNRALHRTTGLQHYSSYTALQHYHYSSTAVQNYYRTTTELLQNYYRTTTELLLNYYRTTTTTELLLQN